MLPPIKNREQLAIVMKRYKRWRGKQRLLALYQCQRTVKNLRFRNEMTAAEVKITTGKLRRLIAAEESRWVAGGGELPIRRNSMRGTPTPPTWQPQAHALALGLKIDTASIVGTGWEGRITLPDVQRAISG